MAYSLLIGARSSYKQTSRHRTSSPHTLLAIPTPRVFYTLLRPRYPPLLNTALPCGAGTGDPTHPPQYRLDSTQSSNGVETGDSTHPAHTHTVSLSLSLSVGIPHILQHLYPAHVQRPPVDCRGASPRCNRRRRLRLRAARLRWIRLRDPKQRRRRLRLITASPHIHVGYDLNRGGGGSG